jgi:hypothetical protein
MRTTIQNPKSLVLLLLLLLSVQFKSKAGHAQGAEMAYSCLAPGVYVVRAVLYRDCLGIATGTSESLFLRSPGCNTGRSVMATYTGVSARQSVLRPPNAVAMLQFGPGQFRKKIISSNRYFQRG